jgi:DNA-binding NtrC family response regulator
MTNEKPRILIVDDDASMIRTTSLILGRKGYTVATAADGPEAIEKVKEQPFDIIFMDIKMPVMDGVETHRRVKEIQPDAVVMMMTAYAVEDLIQQALEDGAYGVLYKPLDIDRMVTVIEEARAGHKGALILVVDDDPGTCLTLRNILMRKGYEVGTAQTGEEAVLTARKRAYDVIFIDMKLPTINGLETYLSIREVNPQMVAIMMTAYRQEMGELVEQALRSHAYTCLYKPIDIEELLRLVDEIWERKRRSRR